MFAPQLPPEPLLSAEEEKDLESIRIAHVAIEMAASEPAIEGLEMAAIEMAANEMAIEGPEVALSKIHISEGGLLTDEMINAAQSQLQQKEDDAKRLAEEVAAKEAEEARLKEEARQIALEEKRVADFLASLTDEEVAAYRCIEDNTIGVFDEAQYRAKNDTYEYRIDEYLDTAPSVSSIAITGNMRKFEQDMQEHRKKRDEWNKTSLEKHLEILEAYQSSLTPIEKEFESCYLGKIEEERKERTREKGFEENSDEWWDAYMEDYLLESENEEAFFNSCTPKGKAKSICQSQGHLLTNIEKASAN